MIPKQFRIHVVLIVAALFMIIFPILSETPDADKAERARAAAAVFLDRVDAEEYGDSWDLLADLAQEKISREKWTEQLAEARERSGTLVEREQEDASFSTEAKDSPEGEYILLSYDSRFEKAADVTEYVTVMLTDQGWKVAGYFMQ